MPRVKQPFPARASGPCCAMLISGILNPALNSLLARVRHTNSLVIADRDTVRLCNADTGAMIDEVRPGWPIAAMGFEDAPGSPGTLLIGGGQEAGRLLVLPLGTR